MNKELIYEIVMPNFPRVVRLSEARRAKYFKPLDRLALKYLQKETLSGVVDYNIYKDIAVDNKGRLHHLKPEFEWKEHKKTKGTEKRLYDKTTKEYIIKNPSVAGTPNDEIINGQSMYNGTYHPNVRDKIMKEIHAYMIPFLKELAPINDYPLIIDGFMYDYGKTCEISKGRMWDVGNRQFPYNKAFEDMLQHCHIIKEDNFDHIIGSPRLIFCDMSHPDFGLPKQHWRGNHIRTLVYQIYKVI